MRLYIQYWHGGLHRGRVPDGDIVSIERVCKGDVDLTIFGNAPCQLPGTPVYLTPETDARYPAAICRTSDRFIDRNSGVETGLIVEMEGFAVAYVCADIMSPAGCTKSYPI